MEELQPMTTIMDTPSADCGENSGCSNQNAMVANTLGPLFSEASNDFDDNMPSSPESLNKECIDLKTAVMEDEVTAQLANSGLIGVAAASAIASSKSKRRFHSFENNPSIRKRQEHRLLKKLRDTVQEYATRVGQQVIVLVCTPGNPISNYKVYGAQPLEDILKKLRPVVTEKLECALEEYIPAPVPEKPNLFDLPPLIIDGIPTPVEKMTQAQLRTFIPLMLKYSTERGKPGWGKEIYRPPWWPEEVPWANVRMDMRSEEEKLKTSWTQALRHVIISCYKFHEREDLLNIPTKLEESIKIQFLPTAVHTNPDGTINIVQEVSPYNSIITLPDSTTPDAQVLDSSQTTESNSSVNINNVQVDEQIEIIDINSETEASQDGQIFLINKDGNRYPVKLLDSSQTTESDSSANISNVQEIQASQNAKIFLISEDGHTLKLLNSSQTTESNGSDNISNVQVDKQNEITETQASQNGKFFLISEDGHTVKLLNSSQTTESNGSDNINNVQVDYHAINSVIQSQGGQLFLINGGRHKYPINVLNSSQTTPSNDSINNAQVGEQVEIIGITSITQSQDGQIFLISENGQKYPITISGVVSLPSSLPKYETMATQTSDGRMSDPLSHSTVSPPIRIENIQSLEMIPGGTHQLMIQGPGNNPPQVLPVLSIQEDPLLANVVTSVDDVKTEGTK